MLRSMIKYKYRASISADTSFRTFGLLFDIIVDKQFVLYYKYIPLRFIISHDRTVIFVWISSKYLLNQRRKFIKEMILSYTKITHTNFKIIETVIKLHIKSL